MTSNSEAKPPDRNRDDAAEAIRYMAVKAAIFILVPLVVAVAVAVWVLA